MIAVAGALRRLVFMAALAPGAAILSASAATIHWVPAERPVAVEVEGARAGDGALVVFAEQGPGVPVPAMAGKLVVAADGRMRFEPRFPLARGVRYRAEYRAPGAEPVLSFFALPADTAPPSTTVRQVYPSGDELPENLLKFYVHFSAPMSRGHIYENIQVRDAAGKVIELAFLELDEELWDPTATRLTLLIDPGRIKRGVKPLVDHGPVFEAGRNYSLTIDAACRDAEGRPLRVAFEKRFRIGPADRAPPDHTKWNITPPAAGTRAPLVVAFGESLDHALASRMLHVVRTGGGELDGEVALGAQEREWSFVPGQPWIAGAHQLVIATTIEDLAGNNIGKPFDVDLFEDVQRRIVTPTVEIAFVVK